MSDISTSCISRRITPRSRSISCQQRCGDVRYLHLLHLAQDHAALTLNLLSAEGRRCQIYPPPASPAGSRHAHAQSPVNRQREEMSDNIHLLHLPQDHTTLALNLLEMEAWRCQTLPDRHGSERAGITDLFIDIYRQQAMPKKGEVKGQL